MVSERTISQPSSTTTTSDDNEEYQVETASEDEHEYDGAVVLHNDANKDVPSFHNISVANSSDVHFGNKTFYQGPVTIKQFVYTNKANGDGGEGEDVGDVEAKVSALKSGVVLDALNISNGLDNPVFIGDAQQKSSGKALDTESNSGVRKGFRRLQRFSKENFLVLVSLLTVLVISLVILMTILLLRHAATGKVTPAIPTENDEQDKGTPIDSPVDPTTNLTLGSKLKLVSRLEWLAQPPVEPADPLVVPVPYVIISHTATENCSSQAQCVFHVRYIQTFHIESRNWWDIGYNFLVGGDGEAYEGRGWTSVGAHTYGYNAKSIGIAFIGTFITVKPPERQMRACKLLIQKGVELGYIKKDYKLLAAKQLYATQSPGEMLYEELKTWDHWAPNP